MAIIGAGGIGFDTAEYLSQSGDSPRFDSTAFSTEWGIDQDLAHRGLSPAGLKSLHPHGRFSCYNVKPAKSVKGWVNHRLIHRTSLAMRGVKMLNSVSYEAIDDKGLHIIRAEQACCLPVDTIIICAGQEPRRELHQPLLDMGKQSI